MHASYKLSLALSAAFLAFSAAASAADIAKGVYLVNGYVTKSTCGSLSASLKVGTATTATVVYPGAGAVNMVLANPATTATSKPGGASSQVCKAIGKVPAAGLNNAAINFECYNDTVSGEATSAEAELKSKFKVGASHSGYISQVTVTSSLVVGGSTLCAFTTDGTYAYQ